MSLHIERASYFFSVFEYCLPIPRGAQFDSFWSFVPLSMLHKVTTPLGVSATACSPRSLQVIVDPILGIPACPPLDFNDAGSNKYDQPSGLNLARKYFYSSYLTQPRR